MTEINIYEILLSRKEQGSVVFVKEEFLLKKIQKKEDVLIIFDHKLTDNEEGSVKQMVYGGFSRL